MSIEYLLKFYELWKGEDCAALKLVRGKIGQKAILSGNSDTNYSYGWFIKMKWWDAFYGSSIHQITQKNSSNCNTIKENSRKTIIPCEKSINQG